jgi:hypothetical protein
LLANDVSSVSTDLAGQERSALVKEKKRKLRFTTRTIDTKTEKRSVQHARVHADAVHVPPDLKAKQFDKTDRCWVVPSIRKKLRKALVFKYTYICMHAPSHR